MILSDQQIERYSRQIIVPGIGGRAQERLLGAHLVLVGDAADIAAALPYLAGAGMGRITVHPVGERAAYERMIERANDLNSDVIARFSGDEPPAAPELMLALVGSARAAEAAAAVCRAHRGATIIARLDAPARIAVLPAPPPCALCANADLWDAPGERGANGGVAAMVAVTEAFKLLARFEERPTPRLFEFSGYAAAPRVLSRRADVRCACEAQ